jgi:hypothetical protein
MVGQQYTLFAFLLAGFMEGCEVYSYAQVRYDRFHETISLQGVQGDGLYKIMSLQGVPIKVASAIIPQPAGSLFWGDVALRFGHELVSNQEFAHCGGAQERRVKVHV